LHGFRLRRRQAKPGDDVRQLCSRLREPLRARLHAAVNRGPPDERSIRGVAAPGRRKRGSNEDRSHRQHGDRVNDTATRKGPDRVTGTESDRRSAWARGQEFRALHDGGPRFRVLALDYDGTIAQGGTLHPDVRVALADVRAGGIATLLVTGRRIDDLRTVAGDLGFADAVVGGCGAVVLYPKSRLSFTLSAPPSPVLLADLHRLDIPAVAGLSIIEAEARFAPMILDVIRKRELPLAIAFNRSRLMVLPQ